MGESQRWLEAQGSIDRPRERARLRDLFTRAPPIPTSCAAIPLARRGNRASPTMAFATSSWTASRHPGIPASRRRTGHRRPQRLRRDGRPSPIPLLQRLWDNALWNQRSNLFAMPTDCPQRDERMGWIGDIQVFLDAAAFNMAVDPFLRRFLREARSAQRPDDAYPIVVLQPLSFPDIVTPGCSEDGIILPHGLWQRYGDTAVIDEHWVAMERGMAFVARGNPDHLWRHDRGLDLGDWLSVDAVRPDDETTPRLLCATTYWAYCAQLMAEMAAATGRDAEAMRYAVIRRAIGDAFAAALVDADGRAGNGSQTSHVLALAMRLVPVGARVAAPGCSPTMSRGAA